MAQGLVREMPVHSGDGGTSDENYKAAKTML